jgi:hypothetical protein
MRLSERRLPVRLDDWQWCCATSIWSSWMSLGICFSLNAAVRIEGHDRAGLERLLRYCARAPFALERLEPLGDNQLVYRFPKPQPDGRTELHLTPLELIERLAALIPPPRLHRLRYHGVLATNAPQRAQVTALARPKPGRLTARHRATPQLAAAR